MQKDNSYLKSWDLTQIPMQEDFVFSEAEFPAFFGGYNNGKTIALCLRAWMHSLDYPGNSGIIVRRTYPQLRDTTQRTFFEIVGCNENTIHDHPMVDVWRMNQSYLRLKNGSDIIFRALDDDASISGLRSLNIFWFGIDQAEELPEAVFTELLGRKGRVSGPPTWGAMVGNPAGHDWIWRMYKTAKNPDPKNYVMYEGSTWTNPFRRPGYIENLMATADSLYIQRYIEGSWDVFKGQVYDEFNADVHIIEPFDIPDDWKAGMGIDVGYNHPTSVVWAAVDWDGNWHFYREHVAREHTPDWHSAQIKAKGWQKEDGTILPIYAPHDIMNRNLSEGLNLQQAYSDEGLFLIKGNREAPAVGIQRIKQMLRVREGIRHPYNAKANGCPRMFIHACCTRLIEELQTYRWKERRPEDEGKMDQTDEVVKVNDDTVDAMRYWAMGWTSRFAPEKQEDNRNWFEKELQQAIEERERDIREYAYA